MLRTAASFHGGVGGGLLGAFAAGMEPVWLWDDRDFFNVDDVSKSWTQYCHSQFCKPPQVIDARSKERIETCDLLIGSPPCKRFSLLAVRNKDRNNYVPSDLEYVEFVRVAVNLNVKVFILENLPSIQKAVKFEERSLVDSNTGEMLVSLKDYVNIVNVHNAFDFGVPQNRRRLFVVGIRNDIYSFLPNLDFLNVGMPEIEEALNSPRSVRDAFKNIESLPNQQKPKHSEKRTKGFDTLEPGQSYYGTANNKRLYWDKPSRTITSHRTQYVHPDQPRTLTVRECARIMGFPDDFIFYGPRTAQLDQVGCGICPQIIYYMVRWLINGQKQN